MKSLVTWCVYFCKGSTPLNLKTWRVQSPVFIFNLYFVILKTKFLVLVMYSNVYSGVATWGQARYPTFHFNNTFRTEMVQISTSRCVHKFMFQWNKIGPFRLDLFNNIAERCSVNKYNWKLELVQTFCFAHNEKIQWRKWFQMSSQIVKIQYLVSIHFMLDLLKKTVKSRAQFEIGQI